MGTKTHSMKDRSVETWMSGPTEETGETSLSVKGKTKKSHASNCGQQET